jgi:hypothetical protein
MRTLTMAAAVLAVALVAGFGGYLEFQGVRNVVRAAASKRWPTTAGSVIAAETSSTTSTDRETRETHVTYSTRTVVRYRVAGRDYGTNVIHFGQTLGSDDPSEAELQRLRYPPGAGVRVSYDPTQPWRGVLKPGVHAEAFNLPVAGLAFLLPMLAVVVMLPDMFRAWGGSDFNSGRDPAAAAVAAIMAFIFTGLGMMGLGIGLRRIWNGHASERWPTTLGEVVFAKVETSEAHDQQTEERSTVFSPRFVYRYEVDGVVHFNNLRRFGRVEGQGDDWASEIAARYPVGTRMQVAYFPTDPDIAVLETGSDREALWLPGVGLVAFLFGMAAFVWVVPAVAGFGPGKRRR